VPLTAGATGFTSFSNLLSLLANRARHQCAKRPSSPDRGAQQAQAKSHAAATTIVNTSTTITVIHPRLGSQPNHPRA
jgi:hypothetical protein